MIARVRLGLRLGTWRGPRGRPSWRRGRLCFRTPRPGPGRVGAGRLLLHDPLLSSQRAFRIPGRVSAGMSGSLVFKSVISYFTLGRNAHCAVNSWPGPRRAVARGSYLGAVSSGTVGLAAPGQPAVGDIAGGLRVLCRPRAWTPSPSSVPTSDARILTGPAGGARPPAVVTRGHRPHPKDAEPRGCPATSCG